MKKNILSMALALVSLCACNNQNKVDALEEVISERRSIRQYTEETVSRELLDRIVENGLKAPSGMNRQSYELRIVDNPDFLETISRACNPDKKSIFVNATAVIFIACDPSYDLSQVDCGLLAENMMLSASSLGLGSCCMGAPIRMMLDSKECEQHIRKLGFSEGYELLLAIALGHPAESPDARPRKDTMVKYVD